MKSEAPQAKKRKTGSVRDETRYAQLAKTVVRKPRLRRGILSRLLELSLDIIFEILAHLLPIDLLRVSRTTKALRRIVFSRTATSSWKRAFSNLPAGLPPCPDDISPPRYATLLFEDTCDECPWGDGDGCEVEWVLRKRFCGTCLYREFRDMGSEHYHSTDPKIVLFRTLVPHLTVQFGESRYFYFHCNAMWKYQHSLLVEGMMPEDWIEIAEAHSQRRSHGDICANWLYERRQELKDEEVQIRNNRIEAIMGRLTDLGWAEEIEHARAAVIRFPTVSQKRALTDRIWSNLQPRLINFMEEKQKERLEPLLRRRLPILREVRAFCLRAFAPCPVPPAADLYDFEPFRIIVEKNLSYDDVKLDECCRSLAGLPDFMLRWCEEKTRELLGMMPPASVNDTDISVLHRASTIFQCAESRSPIIFYPQVLAHAGAFVYTGPVENVDGTSSRSLANLHHAILGETRWNFSSQIRFNFEAFLIAEELVSLAGCHPPVTTTRDMDVMDPIFACTGCSKDGARLCMRWKDAICHVLSNAQTAYQGATFHPMELISNYKAQLDIKFLLEQQKLALYHSESFRFICIRCYERGPLSQIKAHVKHQHNIANVTYNDVLVDADVTPQITCTYRFDELLP